MLRIQAIPALRDNYIWALVRDDGEALLVDPGEAAPVVEAAARDGLRPRAVLLTHHHPDHVGGLPALRERWDLEAWGPDDARIAGIEHRVGEGDRITPDGFGLAFDVLAVPGHTRSHLAFHGGGVLFCGDTLFSLGCGRLFEGTPAQMLASLDRLAALPDDTRVCCGHEYTAANARFAMSLDRDDPALQAFAARAARLTAEGRPTLPARLEVERRLNPFLRPDRPALLEALSRRTGRQVSDRLEAFTLLRELKDHFA